MVVANQAYRLMHNWIGSRRNKEFAITPDWDHRWRTGGSLEEIIEESHLDPDHILEGILRFAERKRD